MLSFDLALPVIGGDVFAAAVSNVVDKIKLVLETVLGLLS